MAEAVTFGSFFAPIGSEQGNGISTSNAATIQKIRPKRSGRAHFSGLWKTRNNPELLGWSGRLSHTQPMPRQTLRSGLS